MAAVTGSFGAEPTLLFVSGQSVSSSPTPSHIAGIHHGATSRTAPPPSLAGGRQDAAGASQTSAATQLGMLPHGRAVAVAVFAAGLCQAASRYSKRRRQGKRSSVVSLKARGPDKAASDLNEPGVLPPKVTAPVAMHNKDDPSVSAANELIQNRLLDEPQYQAVLSLVERHLDKFSTTNMVTAMHQCAKAARDQELLKRQIIGDPNFVTLFNTLRESVTGNCANIKPRTLSDLLWSCAHLNIFDSKLFDEVILNAATRLNLFSSVDIALIVFALGVSAHQPKPRFLQALRPELRDRAINEFSPQHIVMIVYGMMRLGIKDERLMRIASDYMKKTQLSADEGWEPLHVTCMAYAYTKLEYKDDTAYSLMGRKTLEHLDLLSPRQVAMVTVAFAKVAAINQEVASPIMDGIIRVVMGKLTGSEQSLFVFSNREFATYCFGVGKYKLLKYQSTPDYDPVQGPVLNDTDEVAKQFVEQVQKRGIETFAMNELNLINYSLMRLNYRDEKDWLRAAADQFVRRAPEMTSVEIVNAMYAFGRVEYLHMPFIITMLEEVRRRKLLSQMSHCEIATFAYALAVLRVKEDAMVAEVAEIVCEQVREMDPQALAMTIWAMAVTNCRKNSSALVSAALEDMGRRPRAYHPVTVACIVWGGAILTGSNSGLWMLRAMFADEFWNNDFGPANYAMIYYYMASLQAEAGLEMDELSGFLTCKAEYEEITGSHVSLQNRRLSDRLKVNAIPHQENEMVPTLEGQRNAGVRADIIIQDQRMVIEVEGPHRMTVPIRKLLRVLEDTEEEVDIDVKKLMGRPEDVLSEVRTVIECSLTGSAQWKRRLLRRCGWRVITVSYDENEEYIADALDSLKKKERGNADNQEEEGEAPAEPVDMDEVEDSGEEEEDSWADVGEEAGVEIGDSFDDAGRMDSGFEDDSFMQENLSEWELKVRDSHDEAMVELRRRVEEERGNAAAAMRYASHVEYRKWQVAVEREVLKDMIAELA
eukprot:TRINITY_DN110719_c0_g1_i1.p1 TRINITY_DN110719_c0_g1~~TRINITY_DN110719_c0_g1_i1.p1  ORF type:complete len:989 (-),score=240.04 TRINITY_DN110719_c0_g1_i1:173-3139(-)